MPSLTFTSCQAPIAEFTVRAVAEYLGDKLNIPTRYIDDIDWPERYARLDTNLIDIGWICGTPYVRRHDELRLNIELLAAPVMAAPRYQNRPVYFSDVVVRSDSRFCSFDDLRGASWAYNEPSSHSGYHCVRWFLAQRNLDGAFFGRVVESGAHANSLNMILSGETDASAIDATVLEMRLAQERALREKIRVIDAIGPSPIPPYVVGTHVPAPVRQALRHALTHMHEDECGRDILREGQLVRFAEVTDADYDRTREMLRQANTVAL
jgi:phosphonate transport system substrate-binding protein